MMTKYHIIRPQGFAALAGLGLALMAAPLLAAPANPGAPGDSQADQRGPAAGGMPPPEQASKADPMAEYQRLGKANHAAPRAVPSSSKAASAKGRTHLHCVFKLKADGGYSLVRAVEVEGDPLVSEEAAGPIIAEVSKGSDVISVQAHVDPFERRGFSSPDGKGPQGHHFEKDEEANVIVKIPDASLSDTDLDQLSVHFYRWEGTEAIERVDRESLKEYKRVHRVSGLSVVPGRILSEEIRSKGMRAPK